MRNAEPHPFTTLTRDEVITMLRHGAESDGQPAIQAAVHLLTLTEVPGRPELARHVRAGTGTVDGKPAGMAWVKHWGRLADDRAFRSLAGQDARLLHLAASYGAGRPVSLREDAAGFGRVQARRVAEAALIAAGADEDYIVRATEPPAANCHTSPS